MSSKQNLTSKLPGIGTTIFTTMSQLAAEHGAINLSQGYPDFSVPQPLLDLVAKYLNTGHNQYPPMIGIDYLREQISKKVAKLYAAEVNMATEITVTSGATEALFVAFQAIVRADDEVIVFDPAYDSYEPAITLAQGRTIHLPLDDQFNIDWNLVKASITANTRAIVLNSPHNPTGSVLTHSDLDALADIIEARDIYIISDEVYEHMVFDNTPHLSLLSHERLRSRSFVISSFGKTYHATGWKIAYCIAPPEMTEEFRKIHQFVTFTTHTPSQWALAEYLDTCPEHYLNLPSFYQQKRDLFCRLMADSPFELKPSAGTYFQLADYSALSDLPDFQFVEYLTKEIGVAAIPISVLYQTPPDARVIRFCFAKNDQTLHTACEKLIAGSYP